MSNKKSIPVVKEVVVAEWRNNRNDFSGLGCATSLNEQDPALMFTVLLDMERARIFARLGLAAAVKGGGKAKMRDFDFVIPLHWSSNTMGPSLDFRVINISDIEDNTIRAAVQEARLSSGSLIRAELALCESGEIVTPFKKDHKFATTSDTSLDLLSGLFSLCETRAFVLYMGLSNYAEAGLRTVKHALSACQLRQWLPMDTDIYNGRRVMTVEREQIQSGKKYRNRAKDALNPNDANLSRKSPTPEEFQTHAPPPYVNQNSVLVPRSPSTDFIHRHSPPNPTDSLLAEDSANSDAGVAPLKLFTKGKRKLTHDKQESVTRALSERLKQWLCLAFKQNERIYEHTILQNIFDESFPDCVATCDVDRFDTTIAFATAVIACDPHGTTCALYWQHKDDFFKLVDDVRALISWSMRRDPGANIRLWQRFMELGETGRRLLQTGSRDAYNEAKASITSDLVLQKPKIGK